MSAAKPTTTDEAALRDAQAFRPNARPMLIAVGLNLLLAVLLLGAPYCRGKLATERALIAFGEAAGCVLAGKPTRSLGLALPAGERDHFADQVLHADASWPTRCLKQLATVPPEQATFLWPSVKTAIGDVHATAKLLDRELTALQDARDAGVTRVPERPLLALARLRAAMTLLARATNLSDTIDAPAIAFDKPLQGAEPSRLPLTAAQTAATDVWLEGDGVQALALDGRGLSWLSVDAGKIDRFRVKRSSLLRGTLRPQGDTTAFGAFAAFAMRQERCVDELDHCVRRATGIADLALGTEAASNAMSPPEPRWLAAHPRGRVDRSVLITADTVDVLALASAEGALELRRFSRAELATQAEPAVPSNAAELDAALAHAAVTSEPLPKPPLRPTDVWPIPGEVKSFDALVLAGSTTRIVIARAQTSAAPEREPSIEASVLEPMTDGSVPITLGAIAGTQPWISACKTPEPSILAFGSESALALVRVTRDSDGALAATPLESATLELGAPLTAEDPHADRVRLVCGKTGTALLALSTKRQLLALTCQESDCEQRVIANEVASFDGAWVERAWVESDAAQEQLVIAFSGTRDPSIGVVRLQHRGATTAPRVVAGCWDPAAGLCGAPTLAALGTRIVLASRDGADLRALESRDAGESWHPLASLSAGPLPSIDPTQVMDQHRLRKGLEK